MSKQNAPESIQKPPESIQSDREKVLDQYLFERRTQFFWLPRPIVKNKKKKTNRIVNLKKPKAKTDGEWVIKPGNCYAHKMLEVEECTK